MATFHPVETNGGTTTTWVPLTTQLPSAAACYSAIYSQQGGGQLVAFDPFYYSIATTFTTECIPPEATEWWNQPHSSSSTVSSLGPITCPQAYTTAFNVSSGVGSTRIGCCPSGYAFQGNSIDYGTVGQCASSLTPGQSYAFLTISQSPGNWFLSTTAAGPSGSSVIGVQINGWHFGAAAAVATSTTASSSSSSSSSAAATTTTMTSPTSSAVPATTSVSQSSSSSTTAGGTSSSGGLGAGASAGIGAGVAVLILALLGLAVFITVSRRRRRRREQQGHPPPDELRHELPQESGNRSEHYGVWNPAAAKRETPVQMQAVELPTRPVELGGEGI